MAKVLYIKANPKTDEESRTFKVSEAFIEAYKSQNPDDEIIELDLYKEGISFLQYDNVQIHTPPSPDRNHPVLRFAYQFYEADKYVFAEPLWNLNIPAILKAYIDYVCVNGITFKYTQDGAAGLCHGKKAVNITSRGGEYSNGPGAEWEMGDRYLKIILGFMGITDYETIAINQLDVIGNDVEALVNDGINKAKELAKTF